MSDLPSDVHYAGPILSGLRMLCQERRGTSTYLTDGELAQIDKVLTAIGYEESYGRGEEWRASLNQCLFGGEHPSLRTEPQAHDVPAV